jgi:hypothetical protein
MPDLVAPFKPNAAVQQNVASTIVVVATFIVKLRGESLGNYDVSEQWSLLVFRARGAAVVFDTNALR